MDREKWGAAVGLLLVALAAGLYFSGYLILWWLQLPVPLNATTYHDYWKALDLPQAQPYAGKIKAAGIAGFGLPLLAYVTSMFFVLKPRKKGLHGDAHFASKSELGRLGLLKDSPTGIIVGKIGGDFIRLDGTRHALLAAPTRAGKGVGAVIPNLLNFKHSMVVLDVKQEAFDITSGWRSGVSSVYLFNPFAEDRRSHCWNPLSYVRRDPVNRNGDVQAIAASLYPDAPGENPFWINQARACFVTAALFLFDRWEFDQNDMPPEVRSSFPTLGKVYRFLSGDGDDLQELFKRCARQPDVSRDTRLGFNNLTALAQETFASVVASAQAPLLVFMNPVLDRATSSDDFWLTDLRRKVTTVYVGIAPNKMTEASGILNLFFQQAIKLNSSELPQQNPELKYQCLFLLDEFTSMGKVEILADGPSYLAGYNVRIFCVIQSLSQLDAVYGPEKARSMVTNLACQVVYTPREQRDANEYSEMLGFKTARRRQRTRSRGQGSSISYTEIEEKVELMKPQDLKALSPEKEIIFIEGTPHPVMADKIRYYKDRFFMARLMNPVVVKPLEIGRAEA